MVFGHKQVYYFLCLYVRRPRHFRPRSATATVALARARVQSDRVGDIIPPFGSPNTAAMTARTSKGDDYHDLEEVVDELDPEFQRESIITALHPRK